MNLISAGSISLDSTLIKTLNIHDADSVLPARRNLLVNISSFFRHAIQISLIENIE